MNQEQLELERLVHELEHDRLSDEGFARLQALLLIDEGLREEYVRLRELSVSLESYANDEVEAGKVVAWQSPKLWVPLAAAACLMLIGGWLNFQRDAGAPSVPEESMDAGVAVVTEVLNADDWSTGMTVKGGELAIGGGVVALEFFSGVRAVIEGPARVAIDESSLRCLEGRIWIDAPAMAGDFHVRCGEGATTLMGSSLGVDGVDGGAWFPADPTLEVRHTDGTKIAHGEIGSSSPTPEFVTSAMLDIELGISDTRRFQDWLKFSDELARDHRLLVFFPFDRIDPVSRTMRNQAGGPVAGGLIVGALQVEGRFSGKQALSFKSPGDRVRMNVPGEYSAITFAAWVQVDGLDREFNSLFLTDRFQAGNPHWQMDRAGRLILGICKPGGGQIVFYSPPILGSDRLGRWLHLASTFDNTTGEGVHYLNGEIVLRYQTDERVAIHMGTAELGNWGLPSVGEKRPVRSLNGKMDEFQIFSSALGADEVKHLFESKPRELP